MCYCTFSLTGDYANASRPPSARQGLPRAIPRSLRQAAARLKRLAIFWLVCAATGFAAAAGVALLLSVAIDHRLSLKRAAPVPVIKTLERLQKHPRETLNAWIG